MSRNFCGMKSNPLSHSLLPPNSRKMRLWYSIKYVHWWRAAAWKRDQLFSSRKHNLYDFALLPLFLDSVGKHMAMGHRGWLQKVEIPDNAPNTLDEGLWLGTLCHFRRCPLGVFCSSRTAQKKDKRRAILNVVFDEIRLYTHA